MDTSQPAGLIDWFDFSEIDPFSLEVTTGGATGITNLIIPSAAEAKKYKITIRSYDTVDMIASANTVSFTLTIGPDAEVVFADELALSFSEDITILSDANYTAFTFEAAQIDIEEGVDFEYVIESQEALLGGTALAVQPDIFVLDAATDPLKIYIAMGSSVDRETADIYKVVITATEIGGTMRATNATFRFEVNDVDDNAPYLVNTDLFDKAPPPVSTTTITESDGAAVDPTPTVIEFDEAAAGTRLAIFSAVLDDDATAANQLYVMVPDGDTAPFFRVETAGSLTTIILEADIDFDGGNLPAIFTPNADDPTKATFQATFYIVSNDSVSVPPEPVDATDATKINTLVVTMTVRNANDNEPVFARAPMDTPPPLLRVFIDADKRTLIDAITVNAMDVIIFEDYDFTVSDADDPNNTTSITPDVNVDVSGITVELNTDSHLALIVATGTTFMVGDHVVSVTATDGVHTITSVDITLSIKILPTLISAAGIKNIDYLTTSSDGVFLSLTDMDLTLANLPGVDADDSGLIYTVEAVVEDGPPIADVADVFTYATAGGMAGLVVDDALWGAVGTNAIDKTYTVRLSAAHVDLTELGLEPLTVEVKVSCNAEYHGSPYIAGTIDENVDLPATGDIAVSDIAINIRPDYDTARITGLTFYKGTDGTTVTSADAGISAADFMTSVNISDETFAITPNAGVSADFEVINKIEMTVALEQSGSPTVYATFVLEYHITDVDPEIYLTSAAEPKTIDYSTENSDGVFLSLDEMDLTLDGLTNNDGVVITASELVGYTVEEVLEDGTLLTGSNVFTYATVDGGVGSCGGECPLECSARRPIQPSTRLRRYSR